ncbi:MAG: hypothetical protein M0036_18540 [Desulfobacteraceae bacterium]|nr:hypothetical protein [Desulfobacteraceae bacterium]
MKKAKSFEGMVVDLAESLIQHGLVTVPGTIFAELREYQAAACK